MKFSKLIGWKKAKQNKTNILTMPTEEDMDLTLSAREDENLNPFKDEGIIRIEQNKITNVPY